MLGNIWLALAFTAYFAHNPIVYAIHLIWAFITGFILISALVAVCSKQGKICLAKEIKKNGSILVHRIVIPLVVFVITGHFFLGTLWAVICAICVSIESACHKHK